MQRDGSSSRVNKSTDLNLRATGAGDHNSSAVDPSQVLPGIVDDPIAQKVFDLIAQDDAIGLKAFLKSHHHLNLVEMRDSRSFSALCFAAYKNSENCFMALFRFVSEQLSSNSASERILDEWVNASTDDEFTPILFATYHGNYALIKHLMDNCNVDYQKRNKFGSSVLHVAA